MCVGGGGGGGEDGRSVGEEGCLCMCLCVGLCVCWGGGEMVEVWGRKDVFVCVYV